MHGLSITQSVVDTIAGRMDGAKVTGVRLKIGKLPPHVRQQRPRGAHKVDLLPYVDFDTDAFLRDVRRVQPGIEVLALSATRGEGLDD